MTPNATAPSPPSHVPLLWLESVAVAFGGLRALSDVDLEVTRGERLAVLGPNGAGKTTLFNAITGDITPTEGKVLIKGIDCTELPSRLRPQLGVARTYQKTRLFGGLTVEGAVIAIRNSLNHAYYAQPVTPVDILVQRTVSNQGAAALIDAVSEGAGS